MNFNNAKFITSYGLFSQMSKSENIEIAFSGRSNVGKSSLINKIFNRKALARVSSMPGKTTTINFFAVDDIRFVDLPGYGYAKVAKTEKQRWAGLIEGYFNDDRNLRLLFQLVDFRHPPTKLDLDMINYLVEREIPFVIVLTKADKLNKTQRENRLNEIIKEIPYGEQITMIPFSATKGEGVAEIKSIIEDVCKQDEEEL